MADLQRQNFSANFLGLNTRLSPDALPPGKVVFAENIRGAGNQIRTRPGMVLAFSATGFITDISAYASLHTDSAPRILVHSSTGVVTLDPGVGVVGGTGISVGTVGTGGPGATMFPFRPQESTQSWEYVGNATGFDKFSAPDANNAVVQNKVGISEPQPMPDACPDGFSFTEFSGTQTNWTIGGTVEHDATLAWPAGPSGPHQYGGDTQRSSDTCVNIFPDPASPAQAKLTRYTVQVGTPTPLINYQRGETVKFNDGVLRVIEDVYPPITLTGLQVEGIYYFENQTGARQRCVIVPSLLPFGELIILPDAGNPAAGSLPGASTLGTPSPAADLRRGSLIAIAGDVGFVESVTVGPQGKLAIEITVATGHAFGDAITGVPAICVSGIPSTVVGGAITAAQINGTIDKGVGTFTQQFGGTGLPNPFAQSLGGGGVPQENDLIHISLSIVSTGTPPVPVPVIEGMVAFDVDDGSFTKNILYFPISASEQNKTVTNSQPQITTSTTLANNAQVYQQIYAALVSAGYNAKAVLGDQQSIAIDPISGKVSIYGRNGRVIQLNVPFHPGVGVYTEITFTIQSLLRSGPDSAKTLATCKAVQITFNAASQIVVGFGSLWVGGGSQPDVGDAGSPYYYRIVPRSLVGVTGNPSPATRYGVISRLQPIFVHLPSPAYDPPSGSTAQGQIAKWDVFRYGGQLTSWRYVGTALSTDTIFTDNLFDSAAEGGSEIEFDNYEPWPTVDQSWTATFGTNGVTAIQVIGTAIVVNGPSAAFPQTIARWLAGTLITVGGDTTYTLWNRPVPITGGGGGWLFRIIENAGSSVNPANGAQLNPKLFVNEPIVANQHLPYLWGPDASGVVYGAGDPFRPGTLQGSKPNMPDATPNNAYDLTAPSEPVLGGQIIDGMPLVASSARWWQLQPVLGTAQRFNPVETPAGRGLAAPYAHTTDGKLIYFWSSDGIYAMAPGSVAQSLTEADIGNLFPQGGATIGTTISWGGFKIFPPDYRYAAQFRLSVVNNILRAHYYDCLGDARLLVLDMTPTSSGQPRMAWSVDFPGNAAEPIALTTSLQPVEPESTLATTTQRYNTCYLADSTGRVFVEQDFHNDDQAPILCLLGVPEWNAGDPRTQKNWMESMVDMTSPSGGTITPVFNGNLSGTGQNIPVSATRQQTLLSLGGQITNQLGILFAWTDDFTKLAPPSTDCTRIVVPTTLYYWSQEFVPQPMTIASWTSLWTNCGLDGYLYIYRLRIAYTGGPATLNIAAYDGIAPQPITLPATQPGQYVKTEFVPTANKALLFQFSATGNWTPNFAESEVIVCQWGRTGRCGKCPGGLGGSANQS